MIDRPHQHMYNAKWSRMSKAYRLKHPLCVYCLQVDRITAAEVVDHIEPHNGDVGLFWDQGNWQSLCKACHDSVKAKEEARGYAVGCGADGLPVDPKHGWNTGDK